MNHLLIFIKIAAVIIPKSAPIWHNPAVKYPYLFFNYKNILPPIAITKVAIID